MLYFVTLNVTYCYVSYLYIELFKAGVWKKQHVEESLLLMMTSQY
jgi:hypothetical protein